MAESTCVTHETLHNTADGKCFTTRVEHALIDPLWPYIEAFRFYHFDKVNSMPCPLATDYHFARKLRYRLPVQMRQRDEGTGTPRSEYDWYQDSHRDKLPLHVPDRFHGGEKLTESTRDNLPAWQPSGIRAG
jgi:hypothetical protein